jgi:hypothetical protein
MSEEKAIFLEDLHRAICQDKNIISVDEAGFVTSDLPIRGYSVVQAYFQSSGLP